MIVNDNKVIIRKLVRKIFPKKTVVKIYKLRKEASLRDFYRVNLTSGLSCIAMVLNEADHSLISEKIQEATDLFLQYKISVPEIYRFFAEKGIFIVKDAGPNSLESVKKKMGRKKYLAEYSKAINILLKLRFLKKDDAFSEKLPFKYSFTQELFMKELMFFSQYSGIEDLVSDEQMKKVEILFSKVSDSLCKCDFSLQHRDFHSRNIHVKKNGLIVLDHQDARMGPALYDLASLLKDSYVFLSNEDEIFLINYYINEAKEKYRNIIKEEEFFREYYLAVFQRSIKACGTFFYQIKVRDNQKYLRNIPIVLNFAIEAALKIEWLTGDIDWFCDLLSELKKKLPLS